MPAAQTLAELFHPAVALLYCGVALVLAMSSMQPVYLVLTFLGQLAWSACLGRGSALSKLVWQAPLVLILAVANPIFSPSGSTVLLRVGTWALYLESLIYGICQGIMLCNSLMAFSNVSEILTSDKVMEVMARRLPTVALMISMTMRLIPRYTRRGTEVMDVDAACTSSGAAAGRRGRLREAMRLSTVLLGWGMEDSLQTVDSMVARGWQSGARRTTYSRRRFGRLDLAAVLGVGLVGLLAFVCQIQASGQMRFYPRITGIAPWFSYAPYVVFFAVPLATALYEELSCKQ